MRWDPFRKWLGLKPKKPVVIFLPGMLCDKRLWASVMSSLHDVAEPRFVDLRGHDSLEGMLAAIAKSLPKRRHPVVLVGFSMGGYVAQEFMLRHPEQIKKLVLISTSARGYTETERSRHQKVMEDAKAAGVFHGLSGKRLEQFIHPSRYDDTVLVELIKTMALDAGLEVYVRQQTATLNREDRRPDLKALTCPALVIGGADDVLVPPGNTQEIAACIPDATYQSLENCGHIIPLEQPTRLVGLLRNWVA